MTVTMRMPGETRALRLECAAPGAPCPSSRDCFVLAPFAAPPALRPVLSVESFLPEESAPRREAPLPAVSSEEKDTYCRSLRKLIDTLALTGGKTVLSRAIDLSTQSAAADIFARLCRAYPEAAVFSWRSGADVWLGATPELLLDCSEGRVATMSLAGTRPAGTPGPWDAKNIEEQEIVTRFITGTLASMGLRPEAGERGVRGAGPVEHLCTRVTATLPASVSPLEVACALAPTPAVAGWPREEALRHIAALEPHPREYYAGFFGLLGPASARLFVTLRCMRLSPSGRVRLYAGGGVTPLSSPPAEWEETERKASTLLRFL